MRTRLVIGSAAALTAAVHLGGLWAGSRPAAVLGGMLLPLALAAAVLLARGTVLSRAGLAVGITPGRWPLLAGLLGLAVATAFGAVWYVPRAAVGDFGWFAYRPLGDPTGAVRAAVEASVARERWYAVWALLAVCCLVAAAARSIPPPAPASRWLSVGIPVAAVPAAGWLGWDLWAAAWPPADSAGVTHVADLLAAVWPQLLMVLVALAAAVVLARRPARWSAAVWSVAALALFAVPAALAADDSARALSVVWFLAPAGGGTPSAAPGMVAVASGAPGVDTSTLIAGCAVVIGSILLVLGWLTRPAPAPTA